MYLRTLRSEIKDHLMDMIDIHDAGSRARAAEEIIDNMAKKMAKEAYDEMYG